MNEFPIGELATRSGLTPEAIRYYERRGLLTKPQRNASGHRRYGEQALLELRAIRAAQTVGFRLAEIRELLDLVREGSPTCPPIMDLTRRRLAEVERRIAALEVARDCLTAVVDGCGDTPCEVSLERLGCMYDGAPALVSRPPDRPDESSMPPANGHARGSADPV